MSMRLAERVGEGVGFSPSISELAPRQALRVESLQTILPVPLQMQLHKITVEADEPGHEMTNTEKEQSVVLLSGSGLDQPRYWDASGSRLQGVISLSLDYGI